LDIFFEISELEDEVLQIENMVDSCLETFLEEGSTAVRELTECIDFHHLEKPYEELLLDFKLISMSILAVFLLEHALLMFAMGCKYFKSHWYVADFSVVLLSFVLEAFSTFGNFPFFEAAGILVIIRSWRFIRITYGVVESNRDAETAKLVAAITSHEKELNAWIHPPPEGLYSNNYPKASFPNAVKIELEHFLHHQQPTDLERAITQTTNAISTLVRRATGFAGDEDEISASNDLGHVSSDSHDGPVHAPIHSSTSRQGIHRKSSSRALVGSNSRV
jgi:hypothetical protein